VDFGNDNATDVAFVSRTWEGTDEEVARFAANTAAHEVGHTFGLRHVDNAGLNEHMRIAASPSLENAKNNMGFLDQSLKAAEWGNEGMVHTKDANGNVIQQNSYRTLQANLGLASSVGSGSQEGAGTANQWLAPSEGSGSQGVEVSAADRTSGDPAEFGGCGCPLCQGAVVKAEAATTLDTSTPSALGGEQLVTVDPRSGVVTGSPARVQADVTPASLDPNTALTDEVFARGFDSDDPTYSRWS
jgi:hypothetical protein